MLPDDHLQFAQVLRRFRFAAGLSQDELAERSGLSTRAISDLERGQRTIPRLETVRLLASGLALNDHDRAELLSAARPGIAPIHAAADESAASQHPGGSTLAIHRRQPLPIPPTRLLGRDRDLAQLSDLVHRNHARLMTLTGEGGVGKTRLALQFAHEQREAFEGDVTFVDLTPLTDPGLVAATIATAAGVSCSGTLPVLETLAIALQDRKMLLVLDNFEHLLSAADVVSSLLARCESVVIVTTSRERLQLRGEHVVPVSPLDTSTATTLFLERARETNFQFDSSAVSQSIIAAICQKLEGVPLAIELAAARTRTLPPAALLERLDPMLPVLTSGPRDVPERQRTIRNTIAWSYDLLPPREQALFESIAVFTGGASLEAIGEVAAPFESALSLPLSMVESLLDKSLIRETIDDSGTLRITMLEIIREFSAERLESSGNAAATRQAHARWFHDLCRSAEQDLRFGNDQARWFATISREIGNVRTALGWFLRSSNGARLVQMAAALDEYWFAHSLYREVLDWLQAGLALEPSLSDSDLGWALCTAASATRILQDVPAATDYVDRAEIVAGRANDPFLTGRTLLARAALHQVAGEWDAAAALCLQAKPAFERAGAKNYLALMSVEIGHMRQQLGDFDGAAREIDEGLVLMRATGDNWATAMALEIRGHLAVFQGDLDLARDRLAETIAMGSQVGDDRTVLGAIAGFARISLAKGDPDAAAVLLGAIASKTGKGAGIPALTRPMVESLVEQCRKELETESFERAWESGYAMTTEGLIAFALGPPS